MINTNSAIITTNITALDNPSRRKNFKRAVLYGWRLAMSNTGMVVLCGSCLIWEIVVGGGILAIASAATSLASVVVKYGIDCYVFKSEDRMKNMCDALSELESAYNNYEAKLANYPNLCQEMQAKLQNDNDDITPIKLKNNIAKALAVISATFNIAAGVLSLMNSVNHLKHLANPTRFLKTESIGSIGLSAFCFATLVPFTPADYQRMSMQGSINEVNKRRTELGVSAKSPNDIAKLTAELQKRISVLDTEKDQNLTLVNFEALCNKANAIQPTQYSTSYLKAAKEALLDTLHNKNIQPTNNLGPQDTNTEDAEKNNFRKRLIRSLEKGAKDVKQIGVYK